MNEVVVAVYRSASAAEAAVEDLKVARVPSATVRQFVNDPAAQEGLLELHNRSLASRRGVVTVTVEDSASRQCGDGNPRHAGPRLA